MKKVIYAIFVFATMIFTSCTNEDIYVETSAPVIENAVSVNLSLEKFYQVYNFNDTRHNNINVYNDFYRVFNSEHNMFIKALILFYEKSTGILSKSYYGYLSNINDVKFNADLQEGNYYMISALFFAQDKSGETDYWTLQNGTNLRTASLKFNATSVWSIMSVSTNEVSVKGGRTVNMNAVPQPIGSLCYFYYQNFQYKDQVTYNKNPNIHSDNNIRALALYTQKYALEYNLDPNGNSRYNYRSDAGASNWYVIDKSIPTDFNKSWTHFDNNLYGYTYILAPEFNLTFGYILEGKTSFNGYGQANYKVQNGKEYLAYWDWFEVGNPYFGIADNNHWHTYNNARTEVHSVKNYVEKVSTEDEYLSRAFCINQ